MKVITVIVTYNRLQLLKRCVNAVIDQTMSPNEIIVINNGSTDGTVAWLLEQPVTTFTQKMKAVRVDFLPVSNWLMIIVQIGYGLWMMIPFRKKMPYNNWRRH